MVTKRMSGVVKKKETRQIIQDIRRFSPRKCKLKQTSQLVKVADELPVEMTYQSIIDDMDMSHPDWRKQSEFFLLKYNYK